MRNLDRFSFEPVSHMIDNTTLMELLKTAYVKRFFCWHNWVIWRFGDATKVHRVCTKCHKKQKDRNVLAKYGSTWIKEDKFK
jgi:hypothetical protein